MYKKLAQEAKDRHEKARFVHSNRKQKDVDSFLVTAVSDWWTSLETLYDPDGNTVLYWEDWYWENYSLTNAFFVEAGDSELNYPIREQDGPLQTGT